MKHASRNPLSLIAAAAIYVLTAAISLNAQVDEKQIYLQPDVLPLRGWAEPRPQPETFDPTYILTASIYPIGWSADGKFAYFIEFPDEDCGCYFADLIIQDLVTDKTVWKDEYRSEPLEDGREENIDTHWAKKQAEFSAKLREHKIVQQTDLKLIYPSLKFERDTLTPSIDVRIKSDGDFEVIGTVTVRMKSARRGTKIVMRDVYKKGEVSGFRRAMIPGMLKSPFEDRVAIIVVSEYRGWEGPPHITGIQVVGSTLKTGFKK